MTATQFCDTIAFSCQALIGLTCNDYYSDLIDNKIIDIPPVH